MGSNARKEMIIPGEFPVIDLISEVMTFPGSTSRVRLRRDYYFELVHNALNGQCPFVFSVMSQPGAYQAPERFYRIGVVSQLKVEDQEIPIVSLQGRYRAEVISYTRNRKDIKSYWLAKVSPIADIEEDIFEKIGTDHAVIKEYADPIYGYMLRIKKMLVIMINEIAKSRHSEDDFTSDPDLIHIHDIVDNFENYDFRLKSGIDSFTWNIIAILPDIAIDQKQTVLSLRHPMERLGVLSDTLIRSINQLKAGNEFERLSRERVEYEEEKENSDQSASSRPRKSIEPNQKEKDASFVQNAHPELVEKYKKFIEIREYMNEDAIKSTMESFKRLKSLGKLKGEGSEWTVFINHIDFMLDIPWNKESKQEENIAEVEETLNSDHFGLDFAKIHILRYLAGKLLNPTGKGANLCFIGPPGVGKTSLANSIARALGRKLVRLSLGGVRDEAEVRGHRKTYIGALAGQIMREIRRGGVKNPVFVLDEIDKITADFRGDPSAALLEVLDPEQNNSFRDHYLDAPFDLSQVLFIATANDTTPIRPALLDRLEPVFLPGYTRYEKVQIAKRFLIPKATTEVGLSKHKIDFKWPNNSPDEVLYSIIKGYTKESGVRNLERRIVTLGRSLAQEYLKNPKNFSSPEINEGWLRKILGQPKYYEERASKTQVGETIGLAWTQFGGDILYVQSAILPEFKSKELSQTGSLGKVMQESGKLALSLLRLELEKSNNPELLKNRSVHIHVPEGAIEKDGPSAGVTIYCSLYSIAFKKIAKPYVAMTGEITLAGKVTGVGGIKEKVIAAETSGIKEVILPKTNERDLDEVPQSAKDNLKFHFIENVDEALKIMFDENQPA
ncbi:MAG: endopeptidase La [Candidatus Yanofskybacteria bacterium RIFCSPHIGHO2_02_FULL_41_29]|uniref:Lon protease n=1 Tax=Candidatus Yanofskybacteria bacterium RIFCSPHIGHO2_01_FULL_41_53 TaxID=1802663 RepID=A0A1F8EKT2_9BACT|nr:MAG: endopeptidase La [Candidatus Yanofskybacteria bacterium RIFCSPHIGHO2_01_FULL_41_53]OGN12167.1 MAG: endopeptidase La [Candidatus Yanofskybacteria bacterium RIFCSPHIGHO2_02_FULL_41_29]OGN17966.1 MAG: endopeptidase La [Candidatus Yanofskybacteria bacterium RIFCSPHIGHO2_12_FULL_41_9]OGN23668.1 MAG: endopeptidase La [Candidatus Yanofskybacteria bacterium RIFCSPLOWO2_01_FULL_41_67]OGN29226.1 MAG: endopeptidase La [Candidatus Yanofskybacteria bacterium RIFCSPLOWO2_02_FULL_41_13]OGN34814.1 MAG